MRREEGGPIGEMAVDTASVGGEDERGIGVEQERQGGVRKATITYCATRALRVRSISGNRPPARGPAIRHASRRWRHGADRRRGDAHGTGNEAPPDRGESDQGAQGRRALRATFFPAPSSFSCAAGPPGVGKTAAQAAVGANGAVAGHHYRQRGGAEGVCPRAQARGAPIARARISE